ncbi:MAG: iron ABC transporter permease [Anaerolineae bacterium]|nr:iron ABC transporter permease [Anaerolineae bacterium]
MRLRFRNQEDRQGPDGARGRSGASYALLIVPLVFLLVFYFYPLVGIARASLLGLDRLDLAPLMARLASPGNLRVIGFTFGQALLSTVLTLALALPGAYVFARYRFPGKQIIQALTSVPFVLPTVVVAAAFNTVLGPTSGLSRWLGLDLRYTFAAILIAHVFYNYTVVVRMVRGFWSTLDPYLEEAARTLGASPWRVFWAITLPLLLPVVATAAVLVFVFCFTSFGVVLILGGPRFATLEVEIYRQTINFANLPLAAALSLVQVLFTLVMMLAYARLQRRISRPLKLKPQWATQRRPRTPVEIGLVVVNVIVMVVLLALPLLTLVIRSFGAGLLYYATLFENPRQGIFYVPPLAAVGNSLKIALMTMGLALALGLLASLAIYRRRNSWLIDALFMLPLGTSAVTLGLGYLLTMGRPPLALRGTVALIIFAHTLVALPFVVRSVLPSLQSIQPNLREAAALLGAPPARVLAEVELPIAWRALAVGAVFAFTISMGEFGATSMIARPELPTIPVAIYRFLSRPGSLNYGQALAMSTILMVVCVVGFVAIERFRPPGPQAF